MSILNSLSQKGKSQVKSVTVTETKPKWQPICPSVHCDFGYIYTKRGDDVNKDQVVVNVARKPIATTWQEDNHYNAVVILEEPVNEDGETVTIEEADKWVADNKVADLIVDLEPCALGEGDTLIKKLENSEIGKLLSVVRTQVGKRLSFYLVCDGTKWSLVKTSWQNRRKDNLKGLQ